MPDWPTLADEFVEYCAVPDVDGECDLRLLCLVTDVNGIPTAGKSQIIVAVVDHVLHFRIFNGDGKVVVDTNKKVDGTSPQDRSFPQVTREPVAPSRAYQEREGPDHHRCHINRRSHYGWFIRPGLLFEDMRRFTPNSDARST